MDNLAHSLVGLTAAKAGLDRQSPTATTVCVLAANAPDIDIVWLFTGGRWSFLHHHRGITHSIAGTLVLGVMIPTIFWTGDRLIARLRKRRPVIRYRGLLLVSLVVGATHPLMDWTNNYGVRLLLPWSSRWFYGDLVFIIDPFVWLMVGSAAFLLTSQRRLPLLIWSVLGIILTTFVVLAARQRIGLAHPNVVQILWVSVILILGIARTFRLHAHVGRGLAFGSLIVVGLYWGVMGLAHQRAYAQTVEVAGQISTQRGEQFIRAAAMPTLADPLRWQCVVETDRAVYRFPINISGNQGASGVQRFPKPTDGEEDLVTVAGHDPRAQVLVEFARFPFARARDTDCVGQTLVEFADLRYTEPGAPRGTFSLNVSVDCPQK
jgi:inner membrane protein